MHKLVKLIEKKPVFTAALHERLKNLGHLSVHGSVIVVRVTFSNDYAVSFSYRIDDFHPVEVRAGEQVRNKEHDLDLVIRFPLPRQVLSASSLPAPSTREA